MSNSGKRLRKPKSLSLYTLEPLRALQIIWKGKKTGRLEGSRGSGRGVSKNNSGHARRRLTGTNYKSWTFILKLSNYLHYPPGSTSLVRFGPTDTPATRKNYWNLQKIAKNFSVRTIFVLASFVNILSSAGEFCPSEKTFILEFPI